jgi:hypothetical protein
MTRKLRIDGLGRETQFIMPDSHMTDYSRLQWEHKLTGMVLGYTKIAAAGGWRGIEEPITIYRVAGLNSAQVEELVAFLLDSRHSPAIGKLMRDVYVVHNDGCACGYSYEYPDATIDLPMFHGMVRPAEAAKAVERAYGAPRLRGTQDYGWRR